MDTIDQQALIDYFNKRAPDWDRHIIRNEPVIRKILDNAGIGPGQEVLDVACGTGVLFPDYRARGVKSVTAIDIAHEMARRAQEKHPWADVIWGDVEKWPFYRTFDRVMVYNAFPHFPDPARLIRELAGLTRPGGRLSVAHGLSREKLNQVHSGDAALISIGLLSEGELAELLEPWFDLDVVISDEEMYQVAGTRKE